MKGHKKRSGWAGFGQKKYIRFISVSYTIFSTSEKMDSSDSKSLVRREINVLYGFEAADNTNSVREIQLFASVIMYALRGSSGKGDEANRYIVSYAPHPVLPNCTSCSPRLDPDFSTLAHHL